MARQYTFSQSQQPPLQSPLRVEAQPSDTFRPSNPAILRWRDGFGHPNFASANAAFRQAPRPNPTPPPKHSSAPPNLQQKTAFRFVHNQFNEKTATRSNSPEGSSWPRRTTADDDPPSKKRRLHDSRLAKTTLSRRKPLRNADDVHRDLWRSILSFCDPRFLLEAKLVDRQMYAILSNTTSIWRQSRERHLPKVPPCPSRLTEQQYVELLVGRGCQISSCVRRAVTAVAWPFLGRLCLECIHEKTLVADDMPAERQHTVNGEQLALALPMGRTMAGRHIKAPTLSEEGDYVQKRGNVILRSDWEGLEAEYFEVVRNNDEDGIKAWYNQKRRETRKYMLVISAIEKETACQPWRQGIEQDHPCAFTTARKQFFIGEAAKLNPPMTLRVLECMSAYHRALSTGNPPSIRAWETLKSKILPYREQAEKLAGHNFGSPNFWRPDGDSLYAKLVARRKKRLEQPKNYLPEQKFVINLGEQEFKKCLAAGVADCDLLLLTLKNVFDRYDKLKRRGISTKADESVRPIGLNYDGTEGPYTLTFDDAVMIIEDVMEVAVERNSGRGKTVFRSLRCVACSKINRSKLYDFRRGMEHIYKVHSVRVGEGEEYWQYSQDYGMNSRDSGYPYARFPFYRTPWSRCLPLVPNHRDPELMPTWHPDNDWEFVQLDTSLARSAFEGREARRDDVANCGFFDLFKHAASSLQGVRLSTQAMTKLAFRYATEVGERRVGPPCSLEEFINAIPGFCESNPALDFKFLCGICMTDESCSFPGVHLKHPISMKLLHVHWQKRHHRAGLDWTQLIHLPSDSTLLEEMEASDKELQEKQDEVKVWTGKPQGGMRRKRNAKATAILATRSVRSAFDYLFPEVVAEE